MARLSADKLATLKKAFTEDAMTPCPMPKGSFRPK
jgi:hypothetical protein